MCMEYYLKDISITSSGLDSGFDQIFVQDCYEMTKGVHDVPLRICKDNNIVHAC